MKSTVRLKSGFWHTQTKPIRLAASLLLLTLAVANALPALPVQAQNQPLVTVRLTIDRLRKFGCWGELILGVCIAPETPDFYAIVTIDGEEFDETHPIEGNDITPDWEFSKDAAFHVGHSNLVIEIRDEDGFARWKDDHVDVNPNPGRNLNLTVDFSNCSVSGDVSGTGSFGPDCEISLTSKGGNDGQMELAEMYFTIRVERPASAPGTVVRCIHDPIWPQASDTVTITAEALDGNLNAKPVDIVEIYVNGVPNPLSTCRLGAACTSSPLGPFGNRDFSYGCRVRDNARDEEVWTGWRRVQSDLPTRGRAVPVLYTGPRSTSVDFVFIHDTDDYVGGATDANFLNDVRTAIQNAYYGGDPNFLNAGGFFLRRQQTMNFWIALDGGDADGTNQTCTQLDPPPNWDSSYTFADAGVILHANFFRDCASPSRRVFSSEPVSAGTLLHETGHMPFGLADEYCGDTYYFQPDPRPNIYSNQQTCGDDALAIGVFGACRQIQDPSSGCTVNWFRLDPASTVGDDLMVGSGSRSPRPADERRINWFFGRCRGPGKIC